MVPMMCYYNTHTQVMAAYGRRTAARGAARVAHTPATRHHVPVTSAPARLYIPGERRRGSILILPLEAKAPTQNSSMAVTGSKMASVFSLHTLKRAVKNLLKWTLPAKAKKVDKEDKTEPLAAEVEDNLANEALEARFLQIIEASPATLDLPPELRVSLRSAPHLNIQYATFWTTDDHEGWGLCREAPIAAPAPVAANKA